MNEKLKRKLIVTPDVRDGDWDKFVVVVSANEYYAWANIYSDYHSIEEIIVDDDDDKVFVQKKWDGTTWIKVDVEDGETIFGPLALWLKTAAFLCDETMALYRFNDGWTKFSCVPGEDEVMTLEENLADLNCHNGADKNPGITYEEVSLEHG